MTTTGGVAPNVGFVRNFDFKVADTPRTPYTHAHCHSHALDAHAHTLDTSRIDTDLRAALTLCFSLSPLPKYNATQTHTTHNLTQTSPL